MSPSLPILPNHRTLFIYIDELNLESNVNVRIDNNSHEPHPLQRTHTYAYTHPHTHALSTTAHAYIHIHTHSSARIRTFPHNIRHIFHHPIQHIFNKYPDVNYNLYADDIELHSIIDSTDNLQNCLTHLNNWLTTNELLLNSTKAELINISTAKINTVPAFPKFS